MLKRGRDDDDDVHRSSPNGHDANGNFEIKRRKTETSASSDMLPQSPYYTLSTNGAYQGPMMNGMNPYKRRDDEAETPRPGPNMNDLNNFDLKQRHKTMESSVPAPQYDAMNRPHSSIGNSPAYAPAPGYELARPSGTNVPRRQQSFG
jgi:protein SOK2